MVEPLNEAGSISSLLDLVRRAPAAPWRDGDNIPWHDPEFSRRMLAEHLSQEHDRASRRFETIDAHARWIHERLLNQRPARVLDLGCGPGLYTSRLAQLGHACVGIDYSPASIAYAEDEARKNKLRCEYTCQDIRTADYGTGFHLAMLVNGELNSFRPAHANAMLRKANAALVDRGLLLLEAHTFEAVQAIGKRPPFWIALNRGIFSDEPHVWLQEHTWHGDANAATTRFFIIDAASGAVSQYASTQQAYSDDEYRTLLLECGFVDAEFHPSLGGPPQSDMVVLSAWKRGQAFPLPGS